MSYSRDIEQPEYVPADFLNILPSDVEMLVYWDNIAFQDGITSVSATINEEQLQMYNARKNEGLTIEIVDGEPPKMMALNGPFGKQQ